jgi:acetyl-CoA synthetase
MSDPIGCMTHQRTDEALLKEKAEALADPAAYWARQADDLLSWQRKWDTVKETSFAHDDVHIRWFSGGLLNVAANCTDRHLEKRGDKPAIIWEPDDPEKPGRILTYRELHREVMRTANMLKELDVRAGDRVTIYMPMVPEAAIAMLACARIGAVHSVVFGGFSPHALRSRVVDCDSRVVITADGGMRHGKPVGLKANVDEALDGLDVDHVIVLRHTGQDVNWQEGRDIWWQELVETVDDECGAEAFDAEHPLFILYTSGSTGQPKGLLHTSGGYLLYATHTFSRVFDHKEEDVFWCTADVGWITGHSYIVYGPLAAGATTVMFEGVPTWPDASRFWQIVDKYNVSLFYTAPTAIRMLQREGDDFVKRTKRSSLRVLGSVGEPINPEAWHWYHDVVGNGRCAVVDTWWQTETGGHMITPIPGKMPTPAGSATHPYFGIDPVICSPEGKVLEGPSTGALCIRDSWPGQARTIWGDHERFVQTYFSTFPGLYFSGDAVWRDDRGNYWIEGRMDDVINMAGHRLGTAEIEAAINEHAKVAESAVVGIHDDIRGQAIYAFVIMKPDMALDDDIRKELNALLRKEVGPIASLKFIQDAPGLPKTRSGKIMRRILRKIAGGEVTGPEDYGKLGDISTLVNPEHVDALVEGRLNG